MGKLMKAMELAMLKKVAGEKSSPSHSEPNKVLSYLLLLLFFVT